VRWNPITEEHSIDGNGEQMLRTVCVPKREERKREGENYRTISFMICAVSSAIIRKTKSTRMYWWDMQHSYKTTIEFYE
jgi:hypothetical protein